MAKNTTTSNTAVASSNPAPAAKETKKVAKKAEAKVEAVVAAPAPVAAEAKKVTKKAEAKVDAVPVAIAEPVAADAASDSSVSWQDELKTVQTGLETLITSARTLLASTKRLQKQAEREIKDARKKSKKTRVEGDASNRKASIFKVPVPISSELATFLGKTEKDAMECRANVTKAISDYVRTHNLANKQKINADAKLRKLLRLAEGEELSIFNLQSKLKVHYLAKKA
jgi:chromatin remodeling complex protein RSC6